MDEENIQIFPKIASENTGTIQLTILMHPLTVEIRPQGSLAPTARFQCICVHLFRLVWKYQPQNGPFVCFSGLPGNTVEDRVLTYSFHGGSQVPTKTCPSLWEETMPTWGFQ